MEAAMGWDIVARIREPHTGIDVTPFIGVVMAVMIVFMVVSPEFTTHSKLPVAPTAHPMMENRVTLAVDNQGTFYTNDLTSPGPIPARHLAARLGAALAARPPEERDVVYLLADQAVPYGSVLTAVDALRANGVRHMGLIANRPADPLAVDF
jgi:biopolymer transport protein ExbD